MVSMTKAKSPITRISKVSFVTNWSARMLKEMVIPRSRVIRFARIFWAVSDRVPRTPHSRIEVAEHEKSNQRNRLRCYQPNDYSNYNGKSNFHGFGNGFRIIFHVNAAFLLCSDKPDGKGLYNWDKCHVGIGGNCNGADIFGIQEPGIPEWK